MEVFTTGHRKSWRRTRPPTLAAVSLILTALTHAPAVLAIGRYDARNGDECRAQVNANYDAATAQMRANGNLRGIASMNRRGRDVELAECEQMDRSAREATMTKAYRRLSAAVDTLRDQRPVPAGERRALEADYTTILKFPPAPYREAYLHLHVGYLRYAELDRAASAVPAIHRCTDAAGAVEFTQLPCAAGATPAPLTVRPPSGDPMQPSESCEAIRARVAASRQEHDAAVTALLESRATKGPTNWRQFEARRVAALSEMTWQGDRARAAGCSSQ
jgi:hypothetical protein